MGDCKPLPPWQHDPPSHSPGAVSYSLIFDGTITFLVPTPRNITYGGEKEFENYGLRKHALYSLQSEI